MSKAPMARHVKARGETPGWKGQNMIRTLKARHAA